MNYRVTIRIQEATPSWHGNTSRRRMVRYVTNLTVPLRGRQREWLVNWRHGDVSNTGIRFNKLQPLYCY